MCMWEFITSRTFFRRLIHRMGNTSGGDGDKGVCVSNEIFAILLDFNNNILDYGG